VPQDLFYGRGRKLHAKLAAAAFPVCIVMYYTFYNPCPLNTFCALISRAQGEKLHVDCGFSAGTKTHSCFFAKYVCYSQFSLMLIVFVLQSSFQMTFKHFVCYEKSVLVQD